MISYLNCKIVYVKQHFDACKDENCQIIRNNITTIIIIVIMTTT